MALPCPYQIFVLPDASSCANSGTQRQAALRASPVPLGTSSILVESRAGRRSAKSELIPHLGHSAFGKRFTQIKLQALCAADPKGSARSINLCAEAKP